MNTPSPLDFALAPSKNQRSVEARAIYVAAAFAAIAFVLALIYFAGHPNLPIFGRVSIGTTSIVLSAIASFLSYYYVLYQNRKPRKGQSKARKAYLTFNMVALSFIHAAIVFLLVTVWFYVVSQAFQGARIDGVASSVLVATTVGVTSYVVYLVAGAKTTLMVSTALAIFLVAGALTSMITAQNPYWWQIHLSNLGGSGGFSAYAFNLTLIIGGAVVACIADLIADDFRRLAAINKKYSGVKVRTLRTMLMLIGLGLAGVGLFPYNTMDFLHNVSASGMVFLFLALVIGLRIFVPSFSHAFVWFSYAMLGIIFLSLYLFVGVGYFDLTSFELICFVVLFGWLVVFIRQIAAAYQDELTRKTTTR